jgi:hypothetical protein
MEHICGTDVPYEENTCISSENKHISNIYIRVNDYRGFFLGITHYSHRIYHNIGHSRLIHGNLQSASLTLCLPI